MIAEKRTHSFLFIRARCCWNSHRRDTEPHEPKQDHQAHPQNQHRSLGWEWDHLSLCPHQFAASRTRASACLGRTVYPKRRTGFRNLRGVDAGEGAEDRKVAFGGATCAFSEISCVNWSSSSGVVWRCSLAGFSQEICMLATCVTCACIQWLNALVIFVLYGQRCSVHYRNALWGWSIRLRLWKSLHTTHHHWLRYTMWVLSVLFDCSAYMYNISLSTTFSLDISCFLTATSSAGKVVNYILERPVCYSMHFWLHTSLSWWVSWAHLFELRSLVYHCWLAVITRGL